MASTLQQKQKIALLLGAAYLHLAEDAEAAAKDYTGFSLQLAAGGDGAADAAAAAEAAQDAETISQQAAEKAKGGVAAAGAGHGAPKKVASGQGEAFYHLPIGSLIVPHPSGEHGGPNDAVQDAAAKAWYASGHKDVKAGHQTYAVHPQAKVHVPKDTDLNAPVAVAAAHKIVTFGKPEQGKAVGLHADKGITGPFPHTVGTQQELDQNWKELPGEATGPEPGKTSVGGVQVSKDEIHQAITILNGAKSTNVKGPLKAKGHPLADMDHMGVAAQELKDHPGLKVPKGTKKEHVGQVKLAVLHHLAGKAKELEQNEAEAAAAEAAQDKAQAAAAHAQELTPQHTEWGGVPASKTQLAEAAAWLEATMGGHESFKQAMLKKGNPLSGSDYMAAAKAYKAAHPNTAKGWSTKKLMLESLTEAGGHAAKADQETGHDDQAELHKLVMNAVTNGPEPKGVNMPGFEGPTLANGLVSAALSGFPVYVTKNPFSDDDPKKTWVTQYAKPSSSAYYTVTPEHGITFTMGEGFDTVDTLTAQQVLTIAKGNIKAPEEQGSLADWEKQLLAPEAPAGKQAPQPAAPDLDYLAGKTAQAVLTWKKSPEYAQVTQVLKAAPISDLAVVEGSKELDKFLGNYLWMAANYPAATPFYIVLGEQKTYTVAMDKPAEGSFGAAGAAFYEITPDLQVIFHGSSGAVMPSTPQYILSLVQKQFPGPEGKTEQVTVNFDDQIGAKTAVFSLPPGTKVYQKPGISFRYLAFPDGTWRKAYSSGDLEPVDVNVLLALPQWLAQGKLTDITPGKAATAGPFEPETELAGIGGTVLVPPGSTTWQDVNEPGYGTYIRNQDGTWHLAYGANAKADEHLGQNKALDNWVLNGTLKPLSQSAKEYAGIVQAKAHTPDPAVTSKPASPPDAGPPGPDVIVKIKGKEVGIVPAGSKVYYVSNDLPGNVGTKYVLAPDGKWQVFNSSGLSDASTDASTYASYIADKTFIAETAPPPGQEPVPVVVKQVVVGEVPAGSKLYKSTSNYDDNVYARAPDGTWYVASYSVSKSGTYSNSGYDGKVEKGTFKEIAPPTPADLEHLKDLAKAKTLLKDAAVDPETHPKTWQGALAHGLAQNKTDNSDITVIRQKDGTFAVGWPSGSEERWNVKAATLQGTYFDGKGGETLITFEQVTQALNENLTPDSVVIGSDGGYAKSGGHLYKFGYYYNPKSSKTFLEVKSAGGNTYGYNTPYNYGPAAAATYIWHNSNGGTETKSPVWAATQLAKNTEWNSQVKPEKVAPGVFKKAAYASVVKVGGEFHIWSTQNPSGISDDLIEVKADSSGLYKSVKVGVTPLTSTDGLVQTGALLDDYGNTVVKPGIAPSSYHLFGGPDMTKDDVAALLSKMETGYDNGWQGAVKAALPQILPAGAGHEAVVKFWAERADGGSTGTLQRDALLGLLRELLQVPEQPKGAELAAEPVFFKGLPEGIASAHDVFTWTDQGYAQPFTGIITGVHLSGTTVYMDAVSGMDAAALTEKIKAVSAQFGNGKVVGTHTAGLNKTQKIAWLEAWQDGDMAKVFSLDADSGKVSPAHPGAPGNEDTHTVTWAPFDPSQVPASKVIEGNWSDPAKVALPKAEVDNYLIKAGLQHPEFLTAAERRAWVVSHRDHKQAIVDKLSAMAATRFGSGDQPLTEPAAWTDNIQPAKTYDVFVEDKTPPNSWSPPALVDFIADHAAAVLPFQQKMAQDSGYSASNLPVYYNDDIVKAYFDAEEEKRIAELSVPVWTVTKGAPDAGSTHPIWQITQTIPLTGAATQYFFKPGKPYIAEQEDTAAKLGQAWGFKTPASLLLEVEGQFGQAQLKLPAVGDLEYGKPLGFYDAAPIPWDQLTQTQVSGIAMEHALDWALDNDDGRASNFLRMADGSIVGIDKGRSWVDFGKWPGLSGTSEADQRSAQVVTQLYQAIRDHKISKAVADQAYIDVIHRAQKMERLPDARMAAMLEIAFAHRADSKYGSYGDKASYIKAIIARKNSLASDFQTLYGKVYADAGWALPEVPQVRLPEGPGGVQLYSGFTEPGYAEAVHAAKAFGVPAFFGGNDIHDGHVLTWQEFTGPGTANPLVAGEFFMRRGTAFDSVIKWAQSHLNKAASPVPQPTTGKAGVKGEPEFYDKIITAAKTISHHAGDKQFNQEKINGLLIAMNDLQHRLDLAATVVANPESAPDFGKTFGPAQANVDMATYYLALGKKVQKAKETGEVFHPGDLPQWVPPAYPETAKEPAPPPSPVTVSMVSNGRPGGSIGPDGEFHVGHGQGGQDGGQVYRVTLSTGEVIDIAGSDSQGIDLAHRGRVRFRFPSAAGQDAAALERIRSQMLDMGLDMKEAEPDDLELFYWRHLANILADRADGDNSVYGKVWAELKSQFSQHKLEWNSNGKHASVASLADAHLSPGEELAMWHAAWAKLTSAEQVDQWVAKGGHLPHLKHFDLKNPQNAGGKPDWYRFDITRAQIAKLPLVLRKSANPEESAPRMLAGAQFSKDALRRVLDTGSTASLDNPASSGATPFVFTRLNLGKSGFHYVFSPKVLARTETYGWDGDNYGKTEYRKSKAYFGPEHYGGYHQSDNETMVKEALTVLDDVELIKAASEGQRSTLIAELKAIGIDTIRGVPVDQRIVTHFGAHEIAVIRQAFTDHPELLDPLEEYPLTEGPVAEVEAAAGDPLEGWTESKGSDTWFMDSNDDYSIAKTSAGKWQVFRYGELQGTFGTAQEAVTWAEEDQESE